MQSASLYSRLAYTLCLMGLALGMLSACVAPEASGAVFSNLATDNEMVTDTQGVPIGTPEAVRIHRLNLQVSNAYLIESEDGLVLVDAGMPFSDRILVPLLQEFADKPLRLIFITHAHLDHYGGAAELREKTGAPIAIHAADAPAMTEGETPLGSIRDWTWTDPTLPLIERWAQAPLSSTPPDILLYDGAELHEWGLDAVVVHTPGHTPGSSILFVNGKYAFVGDLISTAGAPHAQSAYAHNWPEVAASLRRVQQLHPAIVYPGHGPPLHADEVLQSLHVQYVAAPDESDEPDEATD